MATFWNEHTAGAVKAGLRWFQKIVVSNIDKGPDLVNADYLESINAAETARVSLIGLDSSNVTQLPNGASVPTGKTLVVTDAAGLTAGGKTIGTTFLVTLNVAAGATAADYNGSRILPFACKVVSVRERHEVAGTNGGAVTLMVKKVPSGTARASGTDILAAGIDLKATADTTQSPALHATAANYTFAAGNAVALVPTGTLTSVDGVSVTVEFQLV